MLLVLNLLVALNGPPAKRVQSVSTVIDKAVATWARINTLRASFEQALTNPVTGSVMTSKGELQQRKPNRLAITFSDPAGDRIVADGKDVWVMMSATPGQVLKMSVQQAGASNTDLMGQFLDAPRQKYDIADGGSEKIGTRYTRQLVLTAKPGQILPFIRARVWIDTTAWLIRQFEAMDANGVTRRIRLTSLTPNAKVDSSAFVFVLPKGARLIQP